MQKDKKEKIREQLDKLYEYLQQKSIVSRDSGYTDASTQVKNIITAFDDDSSNPTGTPPPPPGGGH